LLTAINLTPPASRPARAQAAVIRSRTCASRVFHVHGSSTPASSSNRIVSAKGKPTTLEKLPSIRSMNAPASPWTAYPPALSSPSPDWQPVDLPGGQRGELTRVSTATARDPTQTP